MKKKQLSLVTRLLENNALTDLTDHNGNTPLHLATNELNSPIIMALLKNRASLNIQNKEGKTPLHLAAENGDETIIEIFMQHGANPDIKTNDGKTAYDLLSSYQFQEYARYAAVGISLAVATFVIYSIMNYYS